MQRRADTNETYLICSWTSPVHNLKQYTSASTVQRLQHLSVYANQPVFTESDTHLVDTSAVHQVAVVDDFRRGKQTDAPIPRQDLDNAPTIAYLSPNVQFILQPDYQILKATKDFSQVDSRLVAYNPWMELYAGNAALGCNFTQVVSGPNRISALAIEDRKLIIVVGTGIKGELADKPKAAFSGLCACINNSDTKLILNDIKNPSAAKFVQFTQTGSHLLMVNDSNHLVQYAVKDIVDVLKFRLSHGIKLSTKDNLERGFTSRKLMRSFKIDLFTQDKGGQLYTLNSTGHLAKSSLKYATVMKKKWSYISDKGFFTAIAPVGVGVFVAGTQVVPVVSDYETLYSLWDWKHVNFIDGISLPTVKSSTYLSNTQKSVAVCTQVIPVNLGGLNQIILALRPGPNIDVLAITKKNRFSAAGATNSYNLSLISQPTLAKDLFSPSSYYQLRWCAHPTLPNTPGIKVSFFHKGPSTMGTTIHCMHSGIIL